MTAATRSMRCALVLALVLSSCIVAAMIPSAPTDATMATTRPVEAPADTVRVVMTDIEPFVENRDGRPVGFYADIWSVVAAELGVRSEVVWVERFGDLLTTIDDGEADVAVAPLTPSAERIGSYDFTSAVVASGPQLAYHERIADSGGLVAALVSPPVRRILFAAVAGLLVLAHLIWLVERHRSDEEGSEFRPDYLRGIWDGFWWATVTVTTVGYGDKTPRSIGGRAVALLAMLLSLFLVGAFVSQITEILQAARSEPPVATLDEVGDRPVGAVAGSSFARYLDDRGVTVVGFDGQAELLDGAERGDVDLVVTNPYALATAGRERGLLPVGDVLVTEFESFAVAPDSPWREPINRVLAELQASGEIDDIVDRWIELGET